MANSDICSIILCGGGSRRMGRDKAWLPFGSDATLLERMVRLISTVVKTSDIVVVAATEQQLPNLPPGVQIVRDRWPDEGPLVGMASGLTSLVSRSRWVLVASCDVPLMSTQVLELLISKAQQCEPIAECEGVVPKVDGRWQPLTAMYRTNLLSTINELLHQGRRRMTDLLEASVTKELREGELREVDPELQSFRHCNTPEDYKLLLATMGD